LSDHTSFPEHGLYVITRDPSEMRLNILDEVNAAIRGGAAVVQYRAKAGRASVEEARALLNCCRKSRVPLIINDDVDLALKVGADGVHLGREDANPVAVRAILGANAIIGISCYDDLARATHAQDLGATYVAFGRFFPSQTKPDAPCAHEVTLREARKILSVPIVAIGGITFDNGRSLVEAGAGLLAVIEGVFGGGDPESAARRFQAFWTENQSQLNAPPV
jgi:thiamine-phosphate pyrophosphorylase